MAGSYGSYGGTNLPAVSRSGDSPSAAGAPLPASRDADGLRSAGEIPYTLDDVVARHRELEAMMEEIIDEVIYLRAEVAELHRRLANVVRLGRVTELNAANGTVKVAFATDEDGNDVVTGDIRWAMRSGSQTEWDPPKVGEQVLLFSPGGDISMLSWAMHGGFTDQNPTNDNRAAVYKRSLGDNTYIEQTAEQTTIRGPKVHINPA